MQPTPDFTIRSNDTAPNAAFTLEDSSGNAVNLSGATVKFVLINYSTGVTVINASATIVNATGGQVSYTWSATDTRTPGRYTAFWVVTFSGGQVESFPNSDTGIWLQITGPDDAFRCLVGPSAWDAVAYVRAVVEDTQPPPYQLIPDSSLVYYAESAGERFSHMAPLGDFVLGNPGMSPYTSPLETVAWQQRYSLNPTFMAQQGLPAVKEVVGLLYQIGEQILAGADLAFFLLIPSSPLGRFVLDPTAPSTRILRNDFLNELDHYGRGNWEQQTDSQGYPAVDLFPVPQEAGLPLLIRYSGSHQAVALNDGAGGTSYPSIPEQHKRLFAKLLLIEVLEQEINRLSRTTMSAAGQVKRSSSPAEVRQQIDRLTTEVEGALGMYAPLIERPSE